MSEGHINSSLPVEEWIHCYQIETPEMKIDKCQDVNLECVIRNQPTESL